MAPSVALRSFGSVSASSAFSGSLLSVTRFRTSRICRTYRFASREAGNACFQALAACSAASPERLWKAISTARWYRAGSLVRRAASSTSAKPAAGSVPCTFSSPSSTS